MVNAADKIVFNATRAALKPENCEQNLPRDPGDEMKSAIQAGFGMRAKRANLVKAVAAFCRHKI
jgi:hypothetical protein